jgi:hypothetical protein
VQTVLLPIDILAGFLVAGVWVVQLTRWGLLIGVAIGKHGGDFLGAPRRRLLWALPFIALLHPAPYLLAAAIGLAVYSLQGDASDAVRAFTGGFYLYVTLMSMLIFGVHRLQRRRAPPGPTGPANNRVTMAPRIPSQGRTQESKTSAEGY